MGKRACAYARGQREECADVTVHVEGKGSAQMCTRRGRGVLACGEKERLGTCARRGKDEYAHVREEGKGSARMCTKRRTGVHACARGGERGGVLSNSDFFK